MGFDFVHFRGARGQKLRNYLKKTKLSNKLKLIVSKLFLKIIYTLNLCIKTIKTFDNPTRGSLKSSKQIKKGEISLKFMEISEFDQHCTVITAQL